MGFIERISFGRGGPPCGPPDADRTPTWLVIKCRRYPRTARHGTSPHGSGPLHPPRPTESHSESLVPRDHAEAVALLRAQVIGALTRSAL